jgi:hypothetical protein
MRILDREISGSLSIGALGEEASASPGQLMQSINFNNVYTYSQ